MNAILIQDDFRRLVVKLGRLTGRPFTEELIRQGGLVAMDCMKFTPPSTLAKGRKAVARDIRKSFKEFWPERLRNPEHQRLVREGRVDELVRIVSKWKTKYSQWTFHKKEQAKEIHHRERSFSSRRGIYRVAGKARKQYLLVPHEGWLAKNYIKQSQASVGKLKGGWVNALQQLGRKAPAWITNKGPNGSVKLPRKEDKDKELVIANNSPTIATWNRDDKFVNRILRRRMGAMKSEIRNIIRNAKRK